MSDSDKYVMVSMSQIGKRWYVFGWYHRGSNEEMESFDNREVAVSYLEAQSIGFKVPACFSSSSAGAFWNLIEKMAVI